MRISRRIITGGAVAGIFLGACTKPVSIVAKVGRFEISRSDVEYRNQVIRFYYPGEKRDLGLDQLIEAFTLASILELNGVEISDAVLEGENERIKKNSKMPDALVNLMRIFGPNHEAWLHDFVLPTFAQRVIYFDFFLHHPAIHAESRAVAETLLKKSLKLGFSPAARSAGLSPHPIRAVKNPDGKWTIVAGDSEKNSLRDFPDAARKLHDDWLHQADESENQEIVSWLKGRPELVDGGEFWLLVEREKKTKSPADQASFISVSVPKVSYAAWLQERKKQVSIIRF